MQNVHFFATNNILKYSRLNIVKQSMYPLATESMC